LKIIGIAVGRNQIKAALVDEKGSIHNEIWTASHLSSSPEKTVRQICMVINKLESSPGNRHELSNVVGISFPGTMDREKGIVKYIPQFSHWTDVNLKGPIKEKTGFEICIENDASAATLGEKWFGLGKEFNNFVLITLGAGVGGGIVCNNQLVSGKDESGGEIGHISVEPEGRRCSCGNFGCLETYASIDGLRTFYEQTEHNGQDFSLENFFNQIDDFKNRKTLDTYLKILSRGIAITVNLFNPRVVILTGKLSPYLENQLEILKANANYSIIKPLKNSFDIRISPLKANAYLLGAASLAFELNQGDFSPREKFRMRNNILQLKEMVEKKTEELKEKEREVLEKNRKLEENEEKLKLALWASEKGIWDWNLTSGFIFTDEGWLDKNNIDHTTFDGSFSSWCSMINRDDFKAFISKLKKAENSPSQSFELQYRMKTQDNSWIWVLHQGKFIRTPEDDNDEIKNLIGTIHNFTRQKEKNERLAYRANFDPLTNLPNRTLLIDRLNQEIRRSERNSEIFSLFFIDLDGFKMINDTFGHETGDRFLRKIAARIERKRRKSDTFARIGGDEFILIALNIEKMEDLEKLTQKYLQLFAKPFMIDNKKLSVGASIGVSIFPTDGKDSKILIEKADKAMYRAKKEGKNQVCFYSLDS